MSTVRMDRLGASDAALLEKDTQWICNSDSRHKFSKKWNEDRVWDELQGCWIKPTEIQTLQEENCPICC